MAFLIQEAVSEQEAWDLGKLIMLQSIFEI